MARLAEVYAGKRGPPSSQTSNRRRWCVAPLGRYITAHGLSMARLLNVARAIFGLPGILKW